MPNDTGVPETQSSPAQPAKVLRYQPPVIRNGKGMTLLARSDIMVAAVQTIAKGGENNLHSHSAMDGLWFVLKGRARFYTTGDELIGDIGPNESVFIPRDCPYWFEAAGDEVLEILQVEAIDKTIPNRRTDHQPKKADKTPSQLFSTEGTKVGEGGLLGG
jgi:mannose-6-phosphate isomerase-like protein (cupin superfamily)